MRHGFLGVVVALVAGAGVALGQVVPGGPFPAQLREADPGAYASGPMTPDGPRPNIPPNLSGNSEPYEGIGYPPPANWEAFDPNGSPGAYKTPDAPRFWSTFEYLLYWSKSTNTGYPLATTSAAADRGVIGPPSTSVIFPDGNIKYDGISGFRFTTGVFLDSSARFGLEAGGFFTETARDSQVTYSDQTGSPLLARPYFNTATGASDSVIVASPGTSIGYVYETASTRTFGAEANAVFNFYRSYPGESVGVNLNALLGIRYVEFDESIQVASQSNTLNQAGNTNTFNGATFSGNYTTGILEQYRSVNEFYGAQIGLTGEIRADRWSFNFLGKVAIGDMHEIITVSGSTVLMTSSGNFPAQGGVFAQSPTIGKYHFDTFGIIPEGGFTVGYQFTKWFRASLGYNILYFNQVSRPGTIMTGQVDPRLNPSSALYGNATNTLPRPTTTQSEYWLMGLTAGFSIRF